MRYFQFQYHDRNDDGKDAVAERLESGCFHPGRPLWLSNSEPLACYLDLAIC
jgi:hypothetical protein